MLGKGECSETNTSHVVHSNRALTCLRGRIAELEITLENGLVTRYVEAALRPGDHPVDAEIHCRRVAMARHREGVDSGLESPKPGVVEVVHSLRVRARGNNDRCGHCHGDCSELLH